MLRVFIAVLAIRSASGRRGEVRRMDADFNETLRRAPVLAMPHLVPELLPRAFSWNEVIIPGERAPRNLLTGNLNQHLPE